MIMSEQTDITTAERDQIWVLDGMAYRVRDKYTSTATDDLQHAYTLASKRRIPAEITRLGALLQASKAHDIARALESIRAVAPTCPYCDGNMDDLIYSPYCGAQCMIDSEGDK